MLLTKKSEYALLSLVSIAKSDQPKNVDILATELGISESFLAKILQNLAKNGILISKIVSSSQGTFKIHPQLFPM